MSDTSSPKGPSKLASLGRAVIVAKGTRDTPLATLQAENEALRQAMREIYEVWAGSDGFIPETAPEGYQQYLIKQMIDIAQAALEPKGDM